MPRMPAIVPPTMVAIMTATGCILSDDPSAQELTAVWIDPLETSRLSSTISATAGPPEPKAISTAKMPVIQAPTNGTKDKKKYMIRMGTTSGTRNSSSGTMKIGAVMAAVTETPRK